jgi:hypothetical protein
MAKKNRTIEESRHLDDGTTVIPISQGMSVVVDTVDFDKVKNYTWYFSDSTGYGAVKATTRTSTYKILKY